MPGISLDFDPILPLWVLLPAGVALLALAARAIAARARGGWPRLAFVLALLAALAGPHRLEEERLTLPDITLAVVDRSPSNRLPGRDRDADDALAILERRAAETGSELRVIESARDGERTEMFAPLLGALAEVPGDRLSAIVLVTDGRVDDVNLSGPVAATGRPVHVLLTGDPEMADRRIEILEAPEYGLVGRPVSIRLRLAQRNLDGAEPVEITIRRIGRPPERRHVVPGTPVEIELVPERRGEMLVDVAAEPAPDEEVLVNNRALFSINAVRDRLRVLLVSGEPHPGERVWRDTLKSDPAVDLIHFTILRLPTSQDPTPVSQLSLIPFPTERLFAEQLSDFDLVIFDRYSLRGVLELRYFDNLLAYVRGGGAVFVANGPEYAGELSLHRTPLEHILPAVPTGETIEGGFMPELTEHGRRHPVTQALPRSGEGASWGRWFRIVDSAIRDGTTLLTGAGRPLLVLRRSGEGRVAQLMSDHVWLWARGVEGGGPYQELLRRSVHWLMKEPDLEENALSAQAADGRLAVERRSLEEASAEVEVTGPDGARRTLRLEPAGTGIARGEIEAPEFGLYHITDGARETVAGMGPVGTHELSEIVPTTEILAPLAEATGGGVYPLIRGMPEIRRPSARATAAGRGWLGLPRMEAARTTAVDRNPLLPAWTWAALLAMLLGLAWWRESA